MRKIARIKWLLGLLPDVFVRISPLHGPQIIVSGIGHGTVSWQAMYRADPCVYCYGPMASYDHIHPTSRGGKLNGWENIAPACTACNFKKGAKPLVGFLAQRHAGASFYPKTAKPMQQRKAKNTKRALVRHLTNPERCPPPLRFDLADKILAAMVPSE